MNRSSGQSTSTPSPQSRRGFLALMSAIAGGLAFSRSANAEAINRIGNRRERVILMPGEPSPEYVPTGFQLVARQVGPRDGFGVDSTETVLLYVSATAHHPLAIFASRTPNGEFFGTKGRIFTPVDLIMRDSTVVAAQYYDGMWWHSRQTALNQENVWWNTTIVHSLVFPFANFTIGIRASRLAGVNYDELVRVATGMRT